MGKFWRAPKDLLIKTLRSGLGLQFSVMRQTVVKDYRQHIKTLEWPRRYCEEACELRLKLLS